MSTRAVRAAGAVGIAAAVALLGAGPGARAYPGGTPGYQTDVAPFCASCHASLSEEALAGAPGDRAKAELAENKHLALIQKGEGGYAELSPAERTELISHIRALDAASKVELTAPPRVEPGERFTVTVDTTGGAGPVVGVALVDVPHRWHARPAPGVGFFVDGPPQVLGQNFQEQTEWLARRTESWGRNLAFVNVTGVESDAAKEEWGRAQVVWKLEAPDQPGRYPLTAVYWYGTEKASPLGYTVDPVRGKQVRGGGTGHSGRVVFSEPVVVEVQ